MEHNRGSVTTESQTELGGMTDEEIQNAWYSLGIRGSVSDWQSKYRFAREIEKLIKVREGQTRVRQK